MKKLLIIIGVFCAVSLSAQDKWLEQIEQNNTVLEALRQQANAEKTGHRTGIYLENPEVEYHYLWGKNTAGNRTDFAVSQAFDFPTAYHHKNKIAEVRNRQVDLKYRIERKNILLEAQRTALRLIYQNALAHVLSARLEQAQQLADAYERKFDAGDAGILDYNRVKLQLASVQKTYNLCRTEQEYLLGELTRLNGGVEFDDSVMTYSPVSLPADFETLYVELKEKNLVLCYAQQETALSRENEKLRRSLNLPKFSAGYMSEKVVTEHFQGVTIGVSIPLWENKNTLKQIKAQTQANQAVEADANVRYRNEASGLYKKAVNLSQVLESYQKATLAVNSNELLKKALDGGEISLIDFIRETEIYLDVTQEKLETERDLHLTLAELKQWLL
ncbi:transporter [Bacteroidia bacterium]|nr:transporter [Bacteroidia bacterium]